MRLDKVDPTTWCNLGFMDEKSVKLLKEIITENENYHIQHKLKPNQGIISNNIIHMRTSFTNQENENRLLYRLRSKMRIKI